MVLKEAIEERREADARAMEAFGSKRCDPGHSSANERTVPAILLFCLLNLQFSRKSLDKQREVE